MSSYFDWRAPWWNASAACMLHAPTSCALQSGGQCCVVVDVNWRRVFWPGDEAAAKSEILQYIAQAADILKVTDEVSTTDLSGAAQPQR